MNNSMNDSINNTMNNTLNNTLNGKQIFHEITRHLLTEAKPSDYLNKLALQDEFKDYPFTMLSELQYTEQSRKYHPEGNVWNHTMLVLDEAAKVREQSKDAKAFMWAALLHDIGKPGTTRERKGQITSYDHDREGEKLSREFLQKLTDDEDLIHTVSQLVSYHMHMLYVLKKLPYGDNQGLIQKVDAHEIALLCRCDRLGRTGADIEAVDAEYRMFKAELERMNFTNK